MDQMVVCRVSTPVVSGLKVPRTVLHTSLFKFSLFSPYERKAYISQVPNLSMQHLRRTEMSLGRQILQSKN